MSMEDEYQRGVNAGWKKGLELRDRGKITDFVQRAMGGYGKEKREGNREKAYYYQGYMAGLQNAERYLGVVKTLGE